MKTQTHDDFPTADMSRYRAKLRRLGCGRADERCAVGQAGLLTAAERCAVGR
jgi:hypothetical protein